MMMNLFVHKKVVGTIIQIIVQQQITPLILIMAFIKILIQVALSARENVVNTSNAGPLNAGVNKDVFGGGLERVLEKTQTSFSSMAMMPVANMGSHVGKVQSIWF